MKQNNSSLIIFTCEHGAAKSVVAAAYFNKLAGERNLDIRASARGTMPDTELSPKAVEGLRRDGLAPTETTPQNLLLADLESAWQIISFCELPQEYHGKAPIERWDNIPPVSENYDKARDAILENLYRLMNSL